MNNYALHQKLALGHLSLTSKAQEPKEEDPTLELFQHQNIQLPPINDAKGLYAASNNCQIVTLGFALGKTYKELKCHVLETLRSTYDLNPDTLKAISMRPEVLFASYAAVNLWGKQKGHLNLRDFATHFSENKCKEALKMPSTVSKQFFGCIQYLKDIKHPSFVGKNAPNLFYVNNVHDLTKSLPPKSLGMFYDGNHHFVNVYHDEQMGVLLLDNQNGEVIPAPKTYSDGLKSEYQAQLLCLLDNVQFSN